MYIAWAAFYEGVTDERYLNVLIPRVLEEIIRTHGTRPAVVPEMPAVTLGAKGRGLQEVAREICANKKAFHVLFFHADTGGRAIEANINTRREAYLRQAALLCEFSVKHAVFVSPRKETEAWALADRDALKRSLGILDFDNHVEVPADARAAEALQDPKATLARIIDSSSKRKRKVKPIVLLPRIAQEQSIQVLREATSFQAFEQNIRSALLSFGLL